MDPLTSALLTLDRTRQMVDELFAAEASVLPQFATRRQRADVAVAV